VRALLQQLIVVIGYSLPETDAFVRDLFRLSQLRARRLVVLNPDRAVEGKFEGQIDWILREPW